MGRPPGTGDARSTTTEKSSATALPGVSPAVILDKACLSGLSAVIDAARLVRRGEASVAGGQESVTDGR
ncbi:hypothetical protein [Arthrobacter sp. RIT-PI-e]|uniref:thiolase family protein n=1 Tax=Arthrobacter sp. RIT-PI-e TaxID=1681197 RepID=UPI00128FB3A4